MRRNRAYKLNQVADVARTAMAVGSLESDRDRDIADWHAIRRVVFVYMPVLALAPIIAGALYMIG